MNTKLMKYLCNLNQADLKTVLHNFLLSNYEKVINTNEYLIAEGTLPICLVAHLDTVFKQTPHEIFYDKEQQVMWSPEGLGADDRAGVYAILSIINEGYKPSIVFTTDEEIGAFGALKLIEDYPECPFPNLKAIIELDRRGEKDCVFYECDNPDFEVYIQQFGFIPNIGSFSDISVIAPEWGVAAVNLSVGYIDEHSFNERLYVKHLETTIERVKAILNKSISMLNYAYIPLEITFSMNCAICQIPLNISNYTNVEVQGSIFHVCNKCHETYYKPYELTPGSGNGKKTKKRK
jgi:hypothetical protein